MAASQARSVAGAIAVVAAKRPRDEASRGSAMSEIGDIKLGIMEYMEGALGEIEERLAARVDRAVAGLCDRMDDQSRVLQGAINEGAAKQDQAERTMQELRQELERMAQRMDASSANLTAEQRMQKERIDRMCFDHSAAIRRTQEAAERSQREAADAARAALDAQSFVATRAGTGSCGSRDPGEDYIACKHALRVHAANRELISIEDFKAGLDLVLLSCVARGDIRLEGPSVGS